MKKKLYERIYDDLLNKIVFNELKSGDVISETKLCEEYDSSRTPVRQALQKLEDLGFLDIKDGSGTYITSINEQDIKNAFEVRKILEIAAAKTSIERIDRSVLEKLRDQFMDFKENLNSKNYGVKYKNMALADWKLHDLIIGNSENSLLKESALKATYIIRRYQYIYTYGYSRAVDEHIRIIDCLLEKNIEELTKVLFEHLSYK